MEDEVLNPGVVRVAHGRHTVLPANVLAEELTVPVAVVEVRIGEDVVGSEVPVEVVGERVGMMEAEVCLDATEGQIHVAETPRGGVGLLAVDRDVADSPTVRGYKLLTLNKHPARTATRIENAPLEGLNHLNEKLNDTAGRVELAA